MCTRACMESPADPRECECECGGRLHGSLAKRSAPPGAQPSRPRRRNAGLAVAATVTAAITIGFVTVTLSTGSGPGDGGVSVQVDANLNQAVAGLLTLRFAGVRLGPSYATDCAGSATGEVSQFLVRHPCKQYASTTLKVHRPGTAAQAVVSWVVMPTAALASQYKATADAPHTGNPPGERGFSGLCYASGQTGTTVWTEQVKPTGKMPVETEREILQATAPRKLSAGYLQQHCIG